MHDMSKRFLPSYQPEISADPENLTLLKKNMRIKTVISFNSSNLAFINFVNNTLSLFYTFV